MKTIVLIFLMLNISTYCQSQNLVLNPSFENMQNIPIYLPAYLHYVVDYTYNDWCVPNYSLPEVYFAGDTATYYTPNGQSYHPCGVPKNGAGFQYARTGAAYIGFTFFHKPPINSNGLKILESIQGKLMNPLVKNKTYCAGYYASLANINSMPCNGFGMAFLKEKMDTGKTSPSPYVVHLDFLNPEVMMPNSFTVTDTLGWTQVSGSFMEQEGNKEWFVMSNFLPVDSIQFFSFPPNYTPFYNSLRAYYFFDDFFVYEQKPVWITNEDTVVCKGKPIKLRGEQAPEFIWYEINHPEQILSTREYLTISPMEAMTIVMRGDACGYITYDTIHIEVMDCLDDYDDTGIQDFLSNNDVKVFPNPTNSSFNFQLLKQQQSGGTLHISDVNGRQLASHRITQSNQNIGTAQLAPGIYALAYEHKGQMLWRGKLCVVR
jgi:hypothetical protein